jgi:hypothetical protein
MKNMGRKDDVRRNPNDSWDTEKHSFSDVRPDYNIPPLTNMPSAYPKGDDTIIIDDGKFLAETKYHYLDKVMIKSGFYKGAKGSIIDFRVSTSTESVGSYTVDKKIITYLISFTTFDKQRFKIWMPESFFKRMGFIDVMLK